MAQIRNGTSESNEVQYEGDVSGEAIAIGLSQNDPNSADRWLLLVFVHTSQGEFFLGAITTNTAAVDGNASRIVGFAACPGAIGWKVRARNGFPSSNTEFDAQLWVIPGKCCGGGGPYGVTTPPQPPGSGGGENGGGSGGGFTPPVPEN